MTKLGKAFLLILFSMLLADDIMAAAKDSICEENGETYVWISPRNPKAEQPFKIMAVSTDGPVTGLTLSDSKGRRLRLQSRRRGGPPWSLSAELQGLRQGDYRVAAYRSHSVAACRVMNIGNPGNEETTQAWGLATEAFYSAWIGALFAAPPEENLSFASLEPVLRDSRRNFLYNYFGRHEDKSLSLTPDCADLPYVLRAYFAWKVGLPVAYRVCGRGSAKIPPRCGTGAVRTDFTHGIVSSAGFRAVSAELANAVHSGTARTALDDESTDLYPIPLRRDTLWPGTVYADPYGHVLVLTDWIPQTRERPGMLLAVDAQPDNTVARKQVWEGTLLFAKADSAGPGFKAFRPWARTAGGDWRALTNDELIDHPGFAPFSPEQAQLSADDFYAQLARLINPRGLNPKQAYEAALDALVQQIETRALSIDNAETYFRQHPGGIIPMPSGPAIFQTVGPWEDYSTPSRDMRLLVAINVLNGLAEKIRHHPELFVLNGVNPEAAKSEIEQHAAQRIQERSIRYTRSDGSLWELTVADVLARQPAFELAYNPNDCPEQRWGAKPDTEEYSTCRRHAPTAQRAQMEHYRVWFREMRRPVP